jgi:HSP20 family protein
MLREVPVQNRLPDLFQELRRTQTEMNRLVGGLRLQMRSRFPAGNVWAGEEGAIVKAEVPGVDPEQLDITLLQDTVTLRGKRDPEQLGEESIQLRAERVHGPFTRTVVLPFRIESDKVAAHLNLGVLTLELPRPAEDRPRQIKLARRKGKNRDAQAQSEKQAQEGEKQ